jgi:hypothetical protein
MPSRLPCADLENGRLELEVLLDDWFGIAEAIARCPECGQDYLLELLDIHGSMRAWRLAPLDADASRRLVRDLSRGSCDVNRAASEVHAVKAAHPVTGWVVVSADGSLAGLHLVETRSPQTNRSWRDLPLDGDWLRQHA